MIVKNYFILILSTNSQELLNGIALCTYSIGSFSSNNTSRAADIKSTRGISVIVCSMILLLCENN
jgi:hypothetical protein